jgi:hypothetical protein
MQGKQKGRVLSVVLGAIGAICVIAPGSTLAGTLDQQQTDASGAGGLFTQSGSRIAETFTAGISGVLDEVDLYLYKSSGATAPLSVEIHNVSGDTPGATVLASTTPPAVPPYPGGFTPVNFAAPASVVAGTRYAIVASSAAPSPTLYLWMLSASVNPYPAGAAFSSPSPSGPWSTPVATDLAFKTYVTTPDKTPPETVIGFVKIKDTTAKFEFTSSEPGSSFQCKLDKHKFKPCASPKKYKHLSGGKHKLKVQAVDAAGNVDATPAKKKFKI